MLVAAGVERDHADGIAGDHVPVAPGVVEHEREDPVQLVQEVGALLEVEGKDDLAVRIGREGVIRVAGPQLAVVVDLAVDGQHGRRLQVAQRLGAVEHVHDGEPLVGEHRPLDAYTPDQSGPRWRWRLESSRA